MSVNAASHLSFFRLSALFYLAEKISVKGEGERDAAFFSDSGSTLGMV